MGSEHLSPDLTDAQPQPSSDRVPTQTALRGGQTLASVVDDIERNLIRDTLARHRGNISETARSLGLTRRGLYLKLRRLGLETTTDADTK